MARSSADIAAVKSRLDLVDVVRRYVDLRPAAGRFVGLCPFHQEKTPSFSVNPDQGFFYCFGCQAGGDVIDFYSRINGLEFREALEALAEQAGVRLEGLGAAEDPAEARRRNVRKSCLAMHELAQGHFRRTLAAPAGRVAREYLQRRQLDPEVVERFGLGYAADDWQGLHNALRDAGYAPDLGVEAGLLSRGAHERGGRVYDRFRGRLIFPIQDMAGRVIAFGGRILADSKDDGAPKYLNSSDTPIYTKGEHLYGLSQARADMARSRRALLTEGYVDVLALQQHGFGEAVGVLGTALTENQVRRLGQLVSEVELVFDGDAAGRKAALRSAPMVLAQGLKCRVILLPDGLDADDILRQHGRSAFEALLDQAPEGLCFCMDTLRHGAAPKDMLEFTRSFMRSLREPALGAYFLPRLAEGLGLAEAELREALAQGVIPQRVRQDRIEPATITRSTVKHKVKNINREFVLSNFGLTSENSLYIRYLISHPEHKNILMQQGVEEFFNNIYREVPLKLAVRLLHSDVVDLSGDEMTLHAFLSNYDDSQHIIDKFDIDSFIDAIRSYKPRPSIARLRDKKRVK